MMQTILGQCNNVAGTCKAFAPHKLRHTDAQLDGLVWGADPHWAAPQANLASIRLVEARQHVHQGGFPGAILPPESVNLPGP